MERQFEQVSDYPMLKEEQRIEARKVARENLLAKLGGAPRFEDFERKRISRFGPSVERLALYTVALVLFAAFLISAVHIYTTGRETYLEGHSEKTVALIIGAAFVVLAESSILALSLIPTIWETPKPVTRSMYAGIAGSAFIATIGNIDATIIYQSTPFDWVSSWFMALMRDPASWAMATLPPVLTVLVGQGLKYYALSRSRERFEAKSAYEDAVRKWSKVVDEIETQSNWRQTWANALWDAWAFRKRRDVLALISVEEKRLIVLREMQADEWFEMPQFQEISEIAGNSQKEQKVSQQDVIDFLLSNDWAESASGIEIAEATGASEATVSRARRAFSRNGHSK